MESFTNELRYRGTSGSNDPDKFVLSETQPSEHKQVTSETDTNSTEIGGTNYGRTPDGTSVYTISLKLPNCELIPGIGTVFKVPITHSFVHTLSHTLFTSQLTQLTLLTLALQFAIFWYLPRSISGPFFLLYFAFWRAAYDAGLGWVLRKQSEKKWIVRKLRSYGWLAKDGTGTAGWWKKELEAKLGNEGYRWNEVPQEFNSWLIFRQLVDIILLK
jgi:hypothetical protein